LPAQRSWQAADARDNCAHSPAPSTPCYLHHLAYTTSAIRCLLMPPNVAFILWFIAYGVQDWAFGGKVFLICHLFFSGSRNLYVVLLYQVVCSGSASSLLRLAGLLLCTIHTRFSGSFVVIRAPSALARLTLRTHFAAHTGRHATYRSRTGFGQRRSCGIDWWFERLVLAAAAALFFLWFSRSTGHSGFRAGTVLHAWAVVPAYRCRCLRCAVLSVFAGLRGASSPGSQLRFSFTGAWLVYAGRCVCAAGKKTLTLAMVPTLAHATTPLPLPLTATHLARGLRRSFSFLRLSAFSLQNNGAACCAARAGAGSNQRYFRTERLYRRFVYRFMPSRGRTW